MALRRGCDVNDVWPGDSQKFDQVGEVSFDREPVVELLCHQRFAVADPDDLASLDPLDLGRVSIGDLAAPYDRNLKHVAVSAGSFGNSGVVPRLSVRSAS